MHYRERLKELLDDNDIKQKRLAKEIGLTESVISNYTTGRSNMPIEVLVKVAEYFGVTVDYLAGVTDDPALPLKLSKRERQMVEGFRVLSQQQKELILQNIRFMQKQNQK